MNEFSKPEIEQMPIDKQKIIEGDALPEILRSGFGKYRKCLAEELDWRQIVRSEAEQIRELATHPFENLPHGFQGDVKLFDAVVRNENLDTKRALDRSKADFVNRLQDRNKNDDVIVYQEGTKKIHARGKASDKKIEQSTDDSVELTRIYLTVPTAKAPRIFSDLVTGASSMGVLSDIDIVLNLETYDNEESVNAYCVDNTIIIYVPAICHGNEDTGIDFDGVFRAIQYARNANPAMWRLKPDRNVALAKSNILKSFKIPIDDNISFVECDDNSSFDTRDGAKLRQWYGVGYENSGPEYLSKMENIFAQISPGHQGSFQFNKRRRWRMPGLIY